MGALCIQLSLQDISVQGDTETFLKKNIYCR